MKVVDVVVIAVVVVVVLLFIAVLARQRFMLRGVGGIPLALRSDTKRWLYGVAQYHGDELRWYRAMGIGTRPNRTMRRVDVEVIGRRAPRSDEVSALPASAAIVEVRDRVGTVSLAFGDDAVTGFLSWLEASAPRW